MDTLSRRELFKKYSYGLVNSEDIDELQSIFDYASGLIVKDEELANQYETEVTENNANKYVQASDIQYHLIYYVEIDKK